MEPLEASLLRETVDELIFRIDTFELVIRLSKVKQMAFPFVAAPAVLCATWQCVSATGMMC